MTEKVSVIIPAYNEAPRIGEVLNCLKGHPLVLEVIVVDDGSTDDTAQVAGKFSFVKLIRHGRNKGKTAAMVEGARAARSDYILFIDADVKNLKPNYVSMLIRPIIEGKADMSLSTKELILFFKHLPIDFVSGERCMRKQYFLEAIKDLNCWSAEPQLNDYILRNNLRLVVVRLKGTENVLKFEKQGLFRGLRSEIRFVLQLLRLMPPQRLYSQFRQMKKRMLRYEDLYG